MKRIIFFLSLMILCAGCAKQKPWSQIQGWTIVSDSKENDLVVIDAAAGYGINQLQLSHSVIMNLRELRKDKTRDLVTSLVDHAHSAGIKEVLLWDHALYSLSYYPEEFKSAHGGLIDLDDEGFWQWFKADYREMLDLAPQADGIVLTFIETGARAENQYSEKMKTPQEKIAAVVDAVADVVCGEYGKKLYVRTFAYTAGEYDNIVGCLNHVKHQDIILMMKEAPHDFFLTHPNNPFAGKIDRPTIMEFDCSGEFNGQGIIANTWPGHVIKRWSDFVRRPNVIGYVARTDRYHDTRLVGTPNEIQLYALMRYTADTTLTAERIEDDYITERYGKECIPFLKPAFDRTFDIVTSVMYTLGTNTTNHSSLDYDPYKSSYGRHVSGKWINPPVVEVGHGVNRELHYWKDIIEHLSPARFKTADGPLAIEAPFVLDSLWVTPTEQMNEEYLGYVITEKEYAVSQAGQCLELIESAKSLLSPEDYDQLHALFERTLLTARIHKCVAAAYWGYRIYARGPEWRNPGLEELIDKSLHEILAVAAEIDSFQAQVPVGQWNWHKDADNARNFYTRITEGWEEYGGVPFPVSK